MVYFMDQGSSLEVILRHAYNLETEESLALSARLQSSGVISVHCNLCIPGSSNSPASSSQASGTTGVHHHIWLILIFYFLVETGFHHVGQAGLELLTSSGSLE
uniref:Uncharacterized protein n=1 Tax=Papio anubis TaxID=9555 RepID=A0A8I5R0W7_PAPAN